MNPNETRGVAVWAPAIPLGPGGGPLRAEAGPRERSLARLVASMLTQAGRRAIPVAPTAAVPAAAAPAAAGASGGKAWVVSGSDWTLEEALALPAPPGCAVLAWGFADLGERYRWDLHLADRDAKRLLWEGSLERGRGELGSLVAAAAAALDAALAAAVPRAAAPGAAAAGVENWEGRLPTANDDALLELLAAMDVREAVGFGIRIPDEREAFGPFLGALELDPKCALAFTLLADTAFRWVSGKVGSAEVALAALRRAEELLPGESRPAAALAECELRAGRAREALESAKRHLSKGPRHGNQAAYAEELLGRIYVELAEPSLAAAAFRHAVAFDPRRSLSWQHLGHLAAQTGKWDEAEICYVQASRLEPGRADLEEAVKRIRGERMRQREERGPLRPPDANDPPGKG